MLILKVSNNENNNYIINKEINDIMDIENNSENKNNILIKKKKILLMKFRILKKKLQ